MKRPMSELLTTFPERRFPNDPPLEPDDDGRLWPDYWITMTRASDGQTLTFPNGGPWHSASTFWWFDGNGACDCNRHLWFNRHGLGLDDDQFETNYECSDKGYRIESFTMPDGEVLPGDD